MAYFFVTCVMFGTISVWIVFLEIYPFQIGTKTNPRHVIKSWPVKTNCTKRGKEHNIAESLGKTLEFGNRIKLDGSERLCHKYDMKWF